MWRMTTRDVAAAALRKKNLKHRGARHPTDNKVMSFIFVCSCLNSFLSFFFLSFFVSLFLRWASLPVRSSSRLNSLVCVRSFDHVDFFFFSLALCVQCWLLLCARLLCSRLQLCRKSTFSRLASTHRAKLHVSRLACVCVEADFSDFFAFLRLFFWSFDFRRIPQRNHVLVLFCCVCACFLCGFF